jgi:hypothetical protein
MRLQLGLRVTFLLVGGAFLAVARDARADDPRPEDPTTTALPAPDTPQAPQAPDAPAAPAVVPAPDAAPAPAASASTIVARAFSEVGAYADSTATSVLTPSIGASVESPTAGWGISGRYLIDVVSAASPDIVSTASPNWTEVRHAGNLGLRYKPGNFGIAATGSASYTPDYLALAGGGQLTQELDDKNLTLVQGYTYGHDTIGRNGTPFSVFSRELAYHVLSLGASRVVNSGLVIGVFGNAVIERGDQSKPYRYIPMFAPDVAARIPSGASPTMVADTRLEARPLEQLPLERDRFAITARLAWRQTSTTLRVEERAYSDSWGLRATTTDARYFIDLSRRVMIWPHGRFHLQNSVDFWKRAYTSTGVNDLPALRTGDRELSALFTVGAGGGLRIALGKAGEEDAIALTTTLDGFYTSFADTIYVSERYSALATTTLEVTF